MEFNYSIFETGALASNTYVLYNESAHCLIIDPTADCNEVLRFIESRKLLLQGVILTHGHFDHITGIPVIRKIYPDVPVYIHTDDRALLENPELNGSIIIGEMFSVDIAVETIEEGIVKIGDFELNALHLPGHTPGGCAFVIGEVCFCGDALFAGSIGRSDFPGGDGELLIRSIKEKLLNLPSDTVVCPGHGGRTTIGREKRLNPFLV